MSKKIKFNLPHPTPHSQDISNSGGYQQNAKVLVGAGEGSRGSGKGLGAQGTRLVLNL